MNRIQFTNDLLTGVEDVDMQHRQLFELANQAVDPTNPRGTDSTFLASLAFLAEYVHYHFSAEELAMAGVSYPQLDSHRRAHAHFRGLIADLLEASLEVPRVSELRPRLQNAMMVWLTEHIRRVDKEFADFLRQHSADGEANLPGNDALIAAGLIEVAPDVASALSNTFGQT
jgi:hemerythrin